MFGCKAKWGLNGLRGKRMRHNPKGFVLLYSVLLAASAPAIFSPSNARRSTD